MSDPFKNIAHFLEINHNHPRHIIFIAGATASGKSSIAISLANQLDGIIINADSMQVYEEMRVISARPSIEEESQAPHKMFGYKSVREHYNVGDWLNDVSNEIVTTLNMGKVPIIVGGTGLYFTSLIDGISPIPDIKPDIREHYRNLANEIAPEQLIALLAMVDPKLAERLKPNDRQRIIRGLEVYHSTNRQLTDWQENEPHKQFLPEMEGLQLHKFVLTPERQYLYDKINRRFDQMVELGGVDEVQKIKDMQLAPDLTALKAIGVRQIMMALNGEVSMEAAIEKSKTESRRYAKRQMTWQRGNLITFNKVPEQLLERKMSNILSKINI